MTFFFQPIYFFQFLFGLFFPFPIWTFISLFCLEFQFDYFEFQFDYFELQFDYFEFQFEFQFFLISFSYQSRSHFGFLPNFLLRSVSRPFPPSLPKNTDVYNGWSINLQQSFAFIRNLMKFFEHLSSSFPSFQHSCPCYNYGISMDKQCTMARTELLNPKNWVAQVAMNFT